MALIDLLQFRIHSVRCLTPTDHSFLEPGPDAMNLVVITTDQTFTTDVSRNFDLGNFIAGTQRDFDPPLVTYQFDLHEDIAWPRTYCASILLAEQGHWGHLEEWVRDAVRILSEAAASALTEPISDELERALGSDVGGAGGEAVSSAYSAFLAEIFRASNTDVFNSMPIYLDLLTEATLPPIGDTGAQARPITGHGARYMVRFSWARRLLTDGEVIDPMMTEIEVIIETGVNDDLRAGSRADVTFMFRSSDGVSSEERFPFNYDPGGSYWPRQLAGGSTSVRTFRLSTPRPLSTLQEVHVSYVSGRRLGIEGALDEAHPDDWEIDAVVIRYHADESSGLIFSDRGAPLRYLIDGREEFIALPNRAYGIDIGISLQADNGLFVVAEGGGGREVAANRSSIGPWETFTMIYLGGGRVALRANNGQYVAAEGGGGRELLANRDEIGPWENFDLLIQDDKRVALRAHNGQYVGVGGSGEVAANHDRIGPWEKFRLFFR